VDHHDDIDCVGLFVDNGVFNQKWLLAVQMDVFVRVPL